MFIYLFACLFVVGQVIWALKCQQTHTQAEIVHMIQHYIEIQSRIFESSPTYPVETWIIQFGG